MSCLWPLLLLWLVRTAVIVGKLSKQLEEVCVKLGRVASCHFRDFETPLAANGRERTSEESAK